MPVQRALIFANGLMENEDAVRALIQPGDLLIAADGGARHIVRLGFRPGLLVGDLDSLSPVEVSGFAQSGVEILRYPPEKDETDLELAIEKALERECTDLILVGALGGRIDQTLGNIFLLCLPGLAHVAARLDDGRDELFLIRGSGVVRGRIGEIVSLLPLGGPVRGITTQGLRYPLQGESLYPERTRGISNELIAEEARIEAAAGTLICVHTHAIPG